VNGLAPARPAPWGSALLPTPRVELGWQLLVDESSVRVVSSGRTLAEARVSEPDERVVVEFWVDPSGVSAEVTEQLVEQAFTRPAIRPRRAIVVCVPKRDGAVLAHAHVFVSDAVVRPAGVTCLIEGHVGTAAAAALCSAT
jgi:hypothetical protein